MSRKVFISSDMGIDDRLETIAARDDTAALLWPWLLTALDDWGRAEARERRLKAEVFGLIESVTAEDIARALALYAEVGLLQLYVVDGRRYMAVPSERWWRWQTHIRTEKRDRDASRYPAPPCEHAGAVSGPHAGETDGAQLREDARGSAQLREDARLARARAPSPSPSPSLSPSLSPTPSPGRECVNPSAHARGREDVPAVSTASHPPPPAADVVVQQSQQRAASNGHTRAAPSPSRDAIDELVTAFEEAVGHPAATGPERVAWRNWLSHLPPGTTADELKRRALTYRVRYGQARDGTPIPLTAKALAQHWSELEAGSNGNHAGALTSEIAAQRADADARRRDAENTLAAEKRRAAREVTV